MKIRSEFEVSKLEQAQSKDPGRAVEYCRQRAASQMGVGIADKMPYEKDVNQSILDVDRYYLELIILTKRDWRSLELAILDLVYQAATGSAKPGQVVKEILQAVDFYCSPAE